jgi:hypothetical protein
MGVIINGVRLGFNLGHSSSADLLGGAPPYKGHVLLSLDNEDARGAYEAMGFTALGSKMMILVPYECDKKWEHVDNHWRLKDYATTKFIIAFGGDVAASNAS